MDQFISLIKKFKFYKKRLFEKTGIFEMLNYKSIQIDEFEYKIL